MELRLSLLFSKWQCQNQIGNVGEKNIYGLFVHLNPRDCLNPRDNCTILNPFPISIPF